MLTSDIWSVCWIHAEHHNYPTSFLTRYSFASLMKHSQIKEDKLIFECC